MKVTRHIDGLNLSTGGLGRAGSLALWAGAGVYNEVEAGREGVRK